jgi:hypothetical protein
LRKLLFLFHFQLCPLFGTKTITPNFFFELSPNQQKFCVMRFGLLETSRLYNSSHLSSGELCRAQHP